MPFSTKNGGSLGEESVFAGFFEFEIDSACCLCNAWIWMRVCVFVCVRMRRYVIYVCVAACFDVCVCGREVMCG